MLTDKLLVQPGIHPTKSARAKGKTTKQHTNETALRETTNTDNGHDTALVTEGMLQSQTSAHSLAMHSTAQYKTHTQNNDVPQQHPKDTHTHTHTHTHTMPFWGGLRSVLTPRLTPELER